MVVEALLLMRQTEKAKRPSGFLRRQKSLSLPEWVQGAILRGRAGLSILIYVFFHIFQQKCIFRMFVDK